MAANDGYKRLGLSIPKSNFFMMAFPAPKEEDYEKILHNPEIMIVMDGNKEVRVMRREFVIYDWYTIPDQICYSIYGKNAMQTWDWLKSCYPSMTDESKVAFFLFEKITN